MDAREQLRRYLEQRRETGETELVLDTLSVDDAMRLLGGARAARGSGRGEASRQRQRDDGVRRQRMRPRERATGARAPQAGAAPTRRVASAEPSSELRVATRCRAAASATASDAAARPHRRRTPRCRSTTCHRESSSAALAASCSAAAITVRDARRACRSGRDVHALSALRDGEEPRARRRQSERGPDVRRRSAGRDRGRTRAAVRRRRRASCSTKILAAIKLSARRRVHLQCPQAPAARNRNPLPDEVAGLQSVSCCASSS